MSTVCSETKLAEACEVMDASLRSVLLQAEGPELHHHVSCARPERPRGAPERPTRCPYLR